MLIPYLSLSAAALLPILFTIVFHVLETKTKFADLNYWAKQTIIGVVFGGLAVLGTEWGIKVDGFAINCRDAAAIAAGLLFGGPSGIIAGLIGGIERYFSVYWGVGAFTQIACSVSTILAGLIGAAARKFLFKDQRPSFLISFAIGFVVEAFHFFMVFVTNMGAAEQAVYVISVCAFPMILANSLSVLFSSIALYLMERFWNKTLVYDRRPTISKKIQRGLLIANLFSVVATSFFAYSIQNRTSTQQREIYLTQALYDTEDDIKDETNAFMVDRAALVAQSFSEGATPAQLATKYEIAEVSFIDSMGIIRESNVDKYLGYDMHSGQQSSEFLCLLGDEQYYVQDYGPISSDTSISRKYAGIKYGGGFIQIGYDAAQFQAVVSTKMLGITKNKHVGTTGFILIIDEKYDVISAPDSFKYKNLAQALKGSKIGTAGVTFNVTLNDVEYFVKFLQSEGYYLVSLVGVKEINTPTEIVLYVNTLTMILAFAIVFALIYASINRNVVNKVVSVNDSLSQITSGNLDAVVNEHDTREFDSLSTSINQTVGSLKKLIEAEKVRMAEELELARTIQSSALPTNFNVKDVYRSFDIYASMTPAKEVGGDFYDFYITNGKIMNFLIADVSGKGVPAAMFMMKAKTELKALTERGLELNEVFTRANKTLCEGNDANMFLTAWQASFDLATGILTYVNAGHNKPIIKRKNGKFDFVYGKAGFILAGYDSMVYKITETTLQEGDILYLYTDGVTEATNVEGQLFGNERLLETLNKKEHASMEELCQDVKAELEAFFAGRDQFDDITMLAFQYKPNK